MTKTTPMAVSAATMTANLANPAAGAPQLAGPPIGSGAGSGTGSAGSATAPIRPLKGFRLELTQLLAGVQAAFPPGTSITMAGVAATQASMVQELQAALSLYAAVDGQEASLLNARTALRAQLPASHTYVSALKVALIAFFGKSSPQLKQFGLGAKLRTPPTPATKLAAAVKARLTRALRHTQSAKAKAALQFTGAVGVTTQFSAAPAAGDATGAAVTAASGPAGLVPSAAAGPVPSKA